VLTQTDAWIFLMYSLFVRACAEGFVGEMIFRIFVDLFWFTSGACHPDLFQFSRINEVMLHWPNSKGPIGEIRFRIKGDGNDRRNQEEKKVAHD